jgi:hypothetical protein
VKIAIKINIEKDGRMARIRTVKPEFWSDGDMLKLSRDSRLFYIGLWNFADDNGVLEYDTVSLKARIFPVDRIDITKLLEELEGIGKILVYEVENKRYLLIKNLVNHQVIDRKRKCVLPLPDLNQLKSIEISVGREGKGREGKGREGRDSNFPAFEEITLNLWNSFCNKFPNLAPIRELSDTRRTHLKTRFDKESFRDFQAILTAIEEQPFLIYGNPKSAEHKGWKVSFDWLIENDTNYIKVLERKYKENQKPVDPFAGCYKKEK